MTSTPDLNKSLMAVSRAAAAGACVIGGLVLAGWLFDVAALKSIVPGLTAMNPLTATAFVLSAVVLWIQLVNRPDGTRQRDIPRVAHLAVGLVALIGAVTLLGYIIGSNLGIDQVLFRDRLAGNRIAPNTGLNFFLIGLALLLLDAETRGGRRPSQYLALTTAVVTLLVLTGYVFGVRSLYGVAAYIPMALNTALAFALLALGILCARPDRGVMEVVTTVTIGGSTARRLLPASAGILFLLGLGSLQGYRAGTYDAAFGFSLLVVLSTVILSVFVWRNARSLHQADLERRQAEEASRRAREQADRANYAKSEFLSRMSHELRTPLNAILGFGQLLEMDSLNAEQRESVAQILKGGRHLLDLINEVLDIARIEAGRLGLSPEPVAVAEVVGESLDMIAPLAAARNIRIQAEAAGNRFVHADRQRLKQVLLNVLSNAVKYNRAGGTVTLAFEETTSRRLRIRVRDTGEGIALERLERLFIPFDRLGAEQTGVEGTGLGLALSKRLVEAMGGTLGLESTPGEGSTFWVELAMTESPVARLDRMAPVLPAAAEISPSMPAKVVLYIEDNTSNLKLVQRLLAHRPEVRLIPAMQGRLGLDLARQHRPHLILLDLHLPDLSGEEGLRRLRDDLETRHIPVVIITADATRGRAERLIDAGARHYLTKPLDVKKLLAVLDEIVTVVAPDHAAARLS